MRIGIDLDGVCYDFAASVRRWLVSQHGFDFAALPDPEVWDFYKDQWGLSTEQFLRHCNDGVDGGVIFRTGRPFPWTEWAFQSLRQMGHTLHIVTNRSFGSCSARNTEAWLAEWGLRYDSLTFSADKTLVSVDVFIEDNVENYLALDAAGVRVFLMDRPWNRHLADARRVRDWPDFVREVEWMGDEPPESILEEAQRLVGGDRQAAYGHPAEDFTRTGRMWGAILGCEDVPPEKVGLCMAALKISREVHKPKRDNLVDLAGYAQTVALVHDR